MQRLTFALLITYTSNISAQAFDEFSDLSAPTFVSPARMASSLQDSPVSVTRVDTKDLRYLGIDTVVDAIRLVPGMIVSDIHGSNSVVGYHGSNVNVPRRMEVLFNSNSIYRPGYSNVHWHRLPIDVFDLTAIEFIRGSNVIDFGSNAFSGTVNMIQSQPVLEPTFTFETATGSSDKRNVWISGHYSNDANQIVARYFHEENSGFDTLEDSTPIEDDLNGDNLLLIWESELGDGLIGDISVAVNDYSFSPSSIHTIFSDDPDLEFAVAEGSKRAQESSLSMVGKITNSFVSGNIQNSISLSGGYIKFKREQDINLCLSSFFYDPLIAELDASPNIHLQRSDIPLVLSTALNNEIPELRDSIIAPLNENDLDILRRIGERTRELGPFPLLERRCGTSDISVDEDRSTISLLYSREQKNIYSLAVNANLSHSVARSRHYLNGSSQSDDGNLTVNYRRYISEKAIINIGGNIEASTKTTDIYPSYRAAFNYSLFNNHMLRILYSHSERSPDIHELEREWNYTVKFSDGVTDHLGRSSGVLPRVAFSPETLESEKMDTIELGYIYSNALHTLDIKIFKEKLYDLISEPFFYLEFDLSNSGKNDMRGLEGSYVFKSSTSSKLKWGVSFTHLNSTSNNEYESTLISENFGSTFLIFPLHRNITFGAYATYYEDLANKDELRFSSTITYEKQYQSSDLRVSINYRRTPDSINSFTELSTSVPLESRYSNQNQWTFNLSIEY